MNSFSPVLWPSLNASIWDVLKLYFTFRTDVITGIGAKLFPAICLLPIVIFLYDYCKKQLHIEHVLLYLVFLATGISWLVLAKSHSYIHTMINYVVFYFGFIQICLYIIIRKATSLFGRSDESRS